MRIDPFEIAVPDEVLDDLDRRVRSARLPPDLPDEVWRYGTSVNYLRQFVEYWIDEYDWRLHESAMNRYPHYRTSVQGQTIHFMRVPGKGPNPKPMILTHGWPWTFWDFRYLIEPLTDPVSHGSSADESFELIIPSLPGFGFSTPLGRSGLNWWRTADLWVELMAGLGFEKFYASGGDFGMMVTNQMAHKYADRLYAAHISGVVPLAVFTGNRPWSLSQFASDPDSLTEAEWDRRFAVHIANNVISPYTLGHALNDSPVGLASWLIERRREWSDCDGDLDTVYNRDDLLTNIHLYWINETFSSSARFYAEAADHNWVPSHDKMPQVGAPLGISIFEHDRYPAPLDWIQDYYNVKLLRVHDKGGHFSALEKPETILADIRDTFRDQNS